DGRRIDVKDSGVHRLHGPERAVDVLGVDRSRQTVFYAVADFNRLVQIAARDDAYHRAKDLFLGDPHPRRDVGEDRRLDEIAVTVFAFIQSGAAQMQRRAVLILADLDVIKNLLDRLFVDHRPDLYVLVQPVTDAQRLCAFGQFVNELFVDAFVNDDPRRRRASLPGSPERAPDRPLGGQIQ